MEPTRSRPITAAAVAATPDSESARVASEQALPPTVYTEKEDECSVCFDPLSAKRAVTFIPCNHRFHHTCGTKWLQTAKSRSRLNCPLCRKRVVQIEEKGTTRKNSIIPFGDFMQPTRRLLFRWAHIFREREMQVLISWLRQRNSSEYASLVHARIKYSRKELNRSFVDDMRQEHFEFAVRDKIYRDMLRVFASGKMKNDMSLENRWDYAYETNAAIPDLAMDYNSMIADDNKDDEEVDLTIQMESELENEYNKFRQALKFTSGQIPSRLAAHNAAVAAGMIVECVGVVNVLGNLVRLPMSFFIEQISGKGNKRDWEEADAAGLVRKEDIVNEEDRIKTTYKEKWDHPKCTHPFATAMIELYTAATARAAARRAAAAAATATASEAVAQPPTAPVVPPPSRRRPHAADADERVIAVDEPPVRRRRGDATVARDASNTVTVGVMTRRRAAEAASAAAQSSTQ